MGNTLTGIGTGTMAGGSIGGPLGAVIGGGLGAVGGMLADDKANSEKARAHGLTDEAIAALRGVEIPADLANRIYYNQYQSAGNLTPEQEKIINAQPSAAGQVTGDKNLQAAQLEALNALKGISQTGMSATDKARLNQIQQLSATRAEGQRQAILQNFAQRGQGGSGNELIAQLQASQNAANQANQQGLDVAANAQQNALQALGQYGQAAGQMENQKFGQEFQAGGAQDLLNRFNVQNQQGVQQRNVGTANTAQASNLNNQQNILNKNTGDANQEMLRQKEAQQQLFNDQIAKATGQGAASTAGANAYNQMGRDTSTNFMQTAQGVGQLGGQMKGLFANNEPPTTTGTANPWDMGGGVDTKMNGNTMYAAHGGMVQTFDHGGMVEQCYANGGTATPMIAALMNNGGHVPGQAEVPGDSLKNDKIRALLSPGEIVLPRSITMHPDAPSLAKEFVNLELRKKHQR